MAKQETKKSFLIKQVILTGSTFDVTTPVFELKEKWEPSAQFDLKVNEKHVGGDDFHVELIIDIAVKIKEQDIFKLTVSQSGLFDIQGYLDADMDRLKKSFCPNILFPYARQVVSQLTTSAGYPPLNLSPVDFETRYIQMMEQEKSKA